MSYIAKLDLQTLYTISLSQTHIWITPRAVLDFSNNLNIYE